MGNSFFKNNKNKILFFIMVISAGILFFKNHSIWNQIEKIFSTKNFSNVQTENHLMTDVNEKESSINKVKTETNLNLQTQLNSEPSSSKNLVDGNDSNNYSNSQSRHESFKNKKRIPANQISPNKSAKAIELQKWLNQKFPIRQTTDSGWNVTNFENGDISFIRGGEIPCAQIQDLPKVLQPVLEKLDIPNLQLQFKNQSIVGSDEFTMVHIPQVFQDIAIEDAKIIVAYNQITKQIYSISLDTRQLGSQIESEAQQSVNFSKEQAIEIVKNKLSGKIIGSLQIPNQPTIFNKESGKSFLVWRIGVEVTRPLMDAKDYFISVHNGDVVYETSLLMH